MSTKSDDPNALTNPTISILLAMIAERYEQLQHKDCIRYPAEITLMREGKVSTITKSGVIIELHARNTDPIPY